MKLRRIKKKCPCCRQTMVKKGKAFICPDCGTRLLGDTQIRPTVRGDYWTRIWK